MHVVWLILAPFKLRPEVTFGCCCSQALPKLEELEVLNFGDCLVRTDGAKSLAKALEEKHLKLKVSAHMQHFKA